MYTFPKYITYPLTIYILAVVFAFFLNYANKYAKGSWLKNTSGIVKILLKGYTHLIVLCVFFCLSFKSGLYKLFIFMPDDWGQTINGEFYAYKETLSSCLAVLLSFVIIAAFSFSSKYFELKEKEKKKYNKATSDYSFT